MDTPPGAAVEPRPGETPPLTCASEGDLFAVPIDLRAALAPARWCVYEWTDYIGHFPGADRLRIGSAWLLPIVQSDGLFQVRFENQLGLTSLTPYAGSHRLAPALHLEVLARKFAHPRHSADLVRALQAILGRPHQRLTDNGVMVSDTARNLKLTIRQEMKEVMDELAAGSLLYLEPIVDDTTGDVSKVRFLHPNDIAREELESAPARSSGKDIHLFLSVRPDWRDSTSLLGYFNPLTQTCEIPLPVADAAPGHPLVGHRPRQPATGRRNGGVRRDAVASGHGSQRARERRGLPGHGAPHAADVGDARK